MKTRKYRTFVADFETTVYSGQERTEVWAAAIVELFSEDVQVFHSIDELYQYMLSLNDNLIVYFHNLKFDGTFWMSYLLTDLEYPQASRQLGESKYKWLPEKYMNNKSFKYAISDRGQWYSITIKENNHMIELRDSLKLLPFSVKKIGKSFGTKHKKLDMEYTGFRYAGCTITDEEKEYIKNDVLVVKEALEIMYQEGHTKLTIGSCCLSEYKKSISRQTYVCNFPNLYEVPINEAEYGSPNAGEWVRKSYRGGWCYLVPGKSNKRLHNGCTADVNSLYPSMMSSESGNRYPVGFPHFWQGNYIPEEATAEDRYYFVRIRTQFHLKKGKLPFIQIKHSLRYKETEALVTSDLFYDGEYHSTYTDYDGVVKPVTVTLTLTMTDYKLILEHYQLTNCEILDGCWFNSEIGIFDSYIEKYKKIKMESKGAVRELAKLFLNNLYGKMASSTNSSFKYAYVKEDKTIGYIQVQEDAKIPGYIPVGSAITSYARNFTIRAAQKNYHGPDKPGFVYADTDSIHCDISPDKVVGIKTHPTNFCCWKLESYWDVGWFTRQKTYIEHVTHEDGEQVEPWYNVKCAGMPDKCKNLFIRGMTMSEEEWRELKAKPNKTEDELFLAAKRYTLEDFKIGLTVPGKLMPKRIRGGTVLTETTYRMWGV